MAEQNPGTPNVTDHRPQPRGVMPRHAQAWLMAGLAAGILAIIVFTGQSVPSGPSSMAPVGGSQAPDPDRLRSYQERLRLLEAEAQQPSASSPEPSVVAPRDPGTGQAPDPLEAEKRRRAYESLFAGVVVTPRGQQAGAAPPGTRRGALDDMNPLPAGAIPSVDAITESVLRAMARPPVAPHTESPPSPQGATVAPPSREPERNVPTHRLPEGTLIPVVLTNRLDGSAEMPVNGLVTSPVYAPQGQHVLIPAGARVLGTTRPVQTFGESRVAVSLHRLLMPNGAAYALDHFVGLNQIGDAGLRDQVNRHYLSTFGAAGAVGLLTGLSQALGTVGLGGGDGDTTIVLAGGANETTQITARVLDHFLNRLPTVTIREGHRMHVYLTADLDLPVYDARSTTRSEAPAATRNGVH